MILAYQTGVLYPGFVDAPRNELSVLFATHGFVRPAERLRDIDPHRALSSVATRLGSRRKDRLRVVPLAHRTDNHVRAFQIEEVIQAGRERAEGVAGARIYSQPKGISVDGPTSGAPIPHCIALAERIRRRAARLVTHADTRAVSRAVNSMLTEARALRFIARGSYMLSAEDHAAPRVVACLKGLRRSFYDEDLRKGVRASVIEISDVGENLRAVADAACDEAERQTNLVLKELQGDPLRPETRARKLRSAQELLDSLESLSGILGDFGQKLDREIRQAMRAYASAPGPAARARVIA